MNDTIKVNSSSSSSSISTTSSIGGSSSSEIVGEKRKFEGTLSEYYSFLDDLIECSNHLDENERKPALDDAIQKLISVETTNSDLLRSTNLLPPSKRKNFVGSSPQKKK